MACGRCVLVNGIPQNLETIGEAGMAFDAGNSQDLQKKLTDLLNSPEKVRYLGKKARERIEEVYNWEKVVDQLENLFFSLDSR
jgi:glycosyltransferase involved in cell wall biosynthesis